MNLKRVFSFFCVFTLVSSVLNFTPTFTQTAKATTSAFTNFITASGGKLYDGSKELRFSSVNVPFVDMSEDGPGGTCYKLTKWEQEDIVKTVVQMGGQVIRRYPFMTKQPGKTYDAHVQGPNQFSETAFQAFDQFLAICNQYGVRIIVPFVDQYDYNWNGGIKSYEAFRGLTLDDGYNFVTNEQIRTDFKATINYVLNRTNTITGVKYKDDPAILAWETGNELWCENKNYSWLTDIAAYVKSIDSKHLLIDGDYEATINTPGLTDPNIDIMSNHMYTVSNGHTNFAAAVTTDMSYARGKKPYIVGEYGLANSTQVTNLLDTCYSEGVSGVMAWSLRGHREAGGFFQHDEGSWIGDGVDYWAYHWPGFSPVNDNYQESTIMNLVYNNAWKMQGLAVPEKPTPEAPKLLPITNPTQAINWGGSVGATTYDVQRSTDNVTWGTVGADIYDMYKDYSYPPNFKDATATGSAYYYRVIAKNASGSSVASNVVLWDATNQPGEFTQAAPNSGATDVSTTPVFTWGSSDRVTTYSLIVATDSSYTSPIINVTGLTSNSYTPSIALSVNTTYYWKVTANNSSGSIDASNPGITFTTIQVAPGAFNQTAPTSGATGVSTNPSFAWGTSSNAASYTLVVSTSSLYTSPIINKSGITTTSVSSVTTLAPNTKYYWKITAINTGNAVNASNSGISFTTGNAPAAITNDNFESYNGSNTNLQAAYLRNSSGGSVTTTLDTVNKIEGTYGMKYVYDLSIINYAGVTKRLESVNWTGQTELSLWIKPDGSGRTLTIQFQEATTGEVWQTYYTLSGTEAVTLHIPFTSFEHPGWYSGGNGVVDLGSISEYSMYINQGSGTMGLGTLYFDNIMLGQNVTAATVAAGITNVVAPTKDATSLTLPIVPAGYTIAIKSVTNGSTIAINGAITPPTADTTVAVVFTVTNTTDKTTADTASINVLVPANKSIASMNNLIAEYAKNNKLGYQIVVQLTNDLRQAQHQLEKGRNTQAIQFMNDVIKHLNSSGLAKVIDSTAKDVLINDAKELIELWQE